MNKKERDWEVKIVNETFLEGHTSTISDILYYQEKRILVSCSADSIRYWDMDSLRCIFNHALDESVKLKFSVLPNEMIFWDKGSFLVCFDSPGQVKSFSVEKPFVLLKVFNSSTHYIGQEIDNFCLSICRMMKVKDSENHFIIINRKHDFLVFDYEENRVVRQMKSYRVGYTSKLVWSNKYEGCFYYLTDYQNQYKLRLINYQDENVIQEFNDHDKLVDIKLSKNRSGEEIIIACGSDYDMSKDCDINGIFIYNTAKNTSKRTHFIKLFGGAEPNKIIFAARSYGNTNCKPLNLIIPCYYSIVHRFTTNSSEKSCLQFIRFKNEDYSSEGCEVSKITQSYPYEMIHMVSVLGSLSSVDRDVEDFVQVAVCADNKVQVLRLGNMKIPKDFLFEQSVKDFRERTMFLQKRISNEESNTPILEIVLKKNGLRIVVMKCII